MQAQKIYLKDYTSPTHSVSHYDLHFILDSEKTIVIATGQYKRLSESQQIFLNGVDLKLLKIKLNGQALNTDQYQTTSEGLTIPVTPAEFSLEVTTEINPSSNTSLEGLYQSAGILCTQCEAQGFRKISYFLDRPDVMTTYSVAIERDPQVYPVALSNGNLIKEVDLENGRRVSYWEDPFKKPCYLFALVAGQLGKISDTFVTKSQKKVLCEVYSAPGKEELCQFALDSLKKAMKWDEERFDLEYDLDRYMIVAIDDFNAGAMENKGLNIFNSRLVFANPEIATDQDYFNIESVVAHEYFHNWTGNRVTLRDWFQLSLKEGLTVFRDQEFSADMTDRTLQRMTDVSGLMAGQFAEDAGPNAHPVRPESCMAVDNFFTMTIYEKGAEVIRMMQTVVGRPGFQNGMKTYFAKYDGQAVTTEDFAAAILSTNKMPPSLFNEWYSQAGTPEVTISEDWNEAEKKLTVTLSQFCRATAEANTKRPYLIPIKYELLNAQTGQPLRQRFGKTHVNTENESILLFDSTQLTLELQCPDGKPQISWLQDFSAPVNLKVQRSFEESMKLFKNEKNLFNKNRLRLSLLEDLALQFSDSTSLRVKSQAQQIFEQTLQFLQTSTTAPALAAEFLALPTLGELIQKTSTVHIKHLLQAMEALTASEKSVFFSWDLETFLRLSKLNLDLSSESQGLRKLKNAVLSRLGHLDLEQAVELAFTQYQQSQNMTDRVAALKVLANAPHTKLALNCFTDFTERFKDHNNALNYFFMVQANSKAGSTLENVKKLTQHPLFNIKNPNRVYALLRNFGSNHRFMWDESSEAREFILEQIETIDALNPQVAARLCGTLAISVKLPAQLRTGFNEKLKKILDNKGLSKNSRELLEPLLK